jgi:SAM-dependent methyltransferase
MERLMTVTTIDGGEVLGGLRLPSGELTEGARSGRSLRVRNAAIATSFDLAGKRVLDVGCAEGLHSLYMSMSAKEVVGVDHRQSKIANAKANAKALGVENVSFIVGDTRDDDVFNAIGRFDLVIAWGFLHRVSDIFSLIYSLESLSDALSFEWRSPIIPMMSSLSVAYHSPSGKALDPMNISRRSQSADGVHDTDKIEGDTGFWEPTPGAVADNLRRLGYRHARMLG